MADRLHKSDQTRRSRVWRAVRPEALVPAERSLDTGKVLSGRAERQARSKDRHDERDGRQGSGRRRARTGQPSGHRPAGRSVIVAGSVLILAVAASSIAYAVTRDDAAQPTAGQSPTPVGGSAAQPGGGAAATPSVGTGGGATTGTAPTVRKYQGRLTVTWGASTTTNTSMVAVACAASGACVTGLTDTWPATITIPLGSGAPGTYPYAFPRKEDPCTTTFPADAVRGSVVLTETSLSYRSTSPGWEIKCSSTRYTRSDRRTTSYIGRLQP